MSSRRALVLTIGLAVAAPLVLAGCANNNAGSASPTGTVSVSAQPDLSGQVPANIKARGVLTVGTDATYAPNEFKDSTGKIVGFDVELMDAVATKLGLKTAYTESTFDNIIPSITGGKYDIGASSFTDTKAREQTVDFVTYFNAGTQWSAPAGKNVDPDHACGLKVAVQTGSVQETDDLPARNQTCLKAGKPALSVQKYDKQDDATTAVILGKAEAALGDSPVTAYAVKQSGGKLQLAGPVYGAAPYGLPMPKGSPLAPAVRAGLQALMADGTYKSICAKWGNEGGQVTQAKINGAQG